VQRIEAERSEVDRSEEQRTEAEHAMEGRAEEEATDGSADGDGLGVEESDADPIASLPLDELQRQAMAGGSLFRDVKAMTDEDLRQLLRRREAEAKDRAEAEALAAKAIEAENRSDDEAGPFASASMDDLRRMALQDGVLFRDVRGKRRKELMALLLDRGVAPSAPGDD